MLLLAVALSAQPNCEIGNLSASVGVTNPANCQYFVTLAFVHSGTTNQFTVQGNGNNYGTFTYTQLPVVLGPFTAGATATTREFVVKDAVLGDCQADIQVEIAGCATQQPCEIYDATVQTGDCLPGGNGYKITVNFQVENPTGQSFDLRTQNGTFLGTFLLSQLPLTINYPADNLPGEFLKICLHDNPNCCRTVEFTAPLCACTIPGLVAKAEGCTTDSTYNLSLNFQTTATTSDSFAVFANGQFFGNYATSQLPLQIPNFPWNGGAFDEVRVCLQGSTPAFCCGEVEFHVPTCFPYEPCELSQLQVTAGTCFPDSTFQVFLNFQVATPAEVDSFDLWANGQYFGKFGINQLPLTIQNFPWNGNIFSSIKVCTGTAPGCCREKQFLAPSCLPFGPCEITNIFTQTGSCNLNGTYKLRVNFQATNPGNGQFTLFTNGQLYGTFPLTALPLTIPNFPASGNAFDVLKICINDVPGTVACCKTKEFQAPACPPLDSCQIFDLVVDPGACNPAGGYSLVLNFQVQHPGNTQFEVWAGNGQYVGIFPLSALPLTIPNFPGSGSAIGVIKICINDHPNCCKTLEFQAPNCGNICDIKELSVITGDCTSDSTYLVKVNFLVTGSAATNFQLFANGQLFGTYTLSQLPLAIPNFPWNGGNHDVIKICLLLPNILPFCCETIEFEVPECLQQGSCEISDVEVDPGDCHPLNNTYSLVLDFEVQHPGNTQFELWAGNGQYLGIFPLSALPLTLPNFPWGGGAVDQLKICINDQPNCCKIVEIEAPSCFGNNCEIDDLTVQTGDCQGDSSYQVSLNFHVDNPPVPIFSVFANGTFFGSFNLSQLPLTIPNFPWIGGNNDFIKICFGTSGALNCCETLEFEVPNCLSEPCEIKHVQAVHTPCLCGQFFAVITFDYSNGNPGGFDIVGNGNNYGTFPYSTPQPIVLGPFPGDNSTMYEFGVRDHQHPECNDGVLLGKVECPTLAAHDPVHGATLLLAPNPANDWLNATALLPGGARLGQSNVQVYYADGRLIMSQLVADGSSFRLDVAALPAGIYRLALRSDAGNLEGTFTKL